MVDEKLKSDVRAFWESNPLFIGESDLQPGSAEFIAHHEAVYLDDVFPGGAGLEDFFPFPEGARVLDVGCGPGFWIRQLGRRGFRPVGMDLTYNALAISAHSLEVTGLAADLIQGDAENLPFADGALDGIVSNGVIHHTPDTQRCLDEMARVLKPGGTVAVSVYYRNLVLRSSGLTSLLAAIAGKLVGLKGRGRERMLESGTPDEIVRLYDGASNPLGKAYTGPEFLAMVAKTGLTVRYHTRLFFPLRALGGLGCLLKPLHPWLSRRFGLMILVVAEKPSR